MVTTSAAEDLAHEPGADMFGKRYGEVLLVHLTESGPKAIVNCSFPLNDCPAELWTALDANAIAAEHGAQAALLNGPRYWLMNDAQKTFEGTPVVTDFGGIEMTRLATVALAAMNPMPYAVNLVDRKAVFMFNAGLQIYELVDPDGRRWVMQSYSQMVDPDLSLADLPRLGERLTLPAGWTYQARVLTSPLRLDTSTQDAQVVRDDFANTYSLEVDPAAS